MTSMKAGGPLLDDRRLLHEVISGLVDSGHAEADISWSESCGPPADPEHFALEAIFVICNSGMQNKVAARIFEKCRSALLAGTPVSEQFGHPGKSAAIEHIWSHRDEIHDAYMAAPDKIEYCRSLPWIGGITCYHLAKNFGAPVAKPDIHLQRLADRHGTTPQELCEILALRTGFSISTIDLILWRACAERMLDARTGEFCHHGPAAATTVPSPIQHEMFEPEQQELFR